MLAAIGFYLLVMLAENAAFPRWSDWRQMERDGQWTEATVIRPTPKDHGTCYFRYTVDGHVLGGRDGCGRLEAGDTFPVIYMRSKPTFVSMDAPRSRWLGFAIGLGCFSLFVGCVITVLAYWHGRRKQCGLERRQ